MSQKQQQRREQTPAQAAHPAAPAPQTAVATDHLEDMTADLERIKKNDQLLKMAIAGMTQIPALGGEKNSAVFIENIKQQSGE